MPHLIQGQLPFYVAGVLPAEQQARIEQHLQRCPACRHEVNEWHIVAQAVRAEAATRETAVPPLSSIVRSKL